MKYQTPASVLLLAGVSSALPTPQLPSIPGLPSLTNPSSGGSGLGGLGGLPSLPIPSSGAGLGLPNLPGLGGSSSGGSGGLPSLPIPSSGAGLGGLGGLPSLPIPSSGAGLGLPSLPGLGGSSSGGSSGLPSLPGLGGSGGSGTPSIPGVPSIPLPTGAVGGLPSLPRANALPSSGTEVPSLGGSGTENGLESGSCGDMTVIFARGTGEPGNVGIISGPPMFKSLKAKLGDKVVIQGVDYPASAAGNANMGAAGGPAMAESVKKARSKCPNTKIILSGYSQGAMVVHNAFQQGVSSADISGAVLFGDPLKTMKVGDLPADKVKEFCGTQDSICGTGQSPAGGHLSYGSVADEAAAFAIQAAGLA